MVQSEGNMPLKNPVTPLRIDPGTVRLVAKKITKSCTVVVNAAMNKKQKSLFTSKLT
jgi:hypothetical protein